MRRASKKSRKSKSLFDFLDFFDAVISVKNDQSLESTPPGSHTSLLHGGND